jgi:hypothetical protein
MFVEGKKTLASYVPEAAVAGGVMWLLALLLPELIPAEQGSGADYHVTNVPLFSLYVALGAVAFLIFPIAVSGLRLRAARQETPMGLAGKIGTILVWVGAALVVVQFVTLIAGAISGTPSQFWILFFFGAPLFSLGMILFGISALRAWRGQPGRIAPLLSGIFALLAILIEADPYHDIAFALFGLTWVFLGLTMWRWDRHLQGRTDSAAPSS